MTSEKKSDVKSATPASAARYDLFYLALTLLMIGVQWYIMVSWLCDPIRLRSGLLLFLLTLPVLASFGFFIQKRSRVYHLMVVSSYMLMVFYFLGDVRTS